MNCSTSFNNSSRNTNPVTLVCSKEFLGVHCEFSPESVLILLRTIILVNTAKNIFIKCKLSTQLPESFTSHLTATFPDQPDLQNSISLEHVRSSACLCQQFRQSPLVGIEEITASTHFSISLYLLVFASTLFGRSFN